MATPETIAKAFHEHYYNTFDQNRQALAGLYQENAILSFEGNQIQGQANIMQKLTTLPFTQVKHHVSTCDVQPSLSNGIIVFITGQILPEGETNPLKFSQVFHLAATGGSFVITNDIFRLNYA